MQIFLTITSNKLGETLEARDNVEYIVTLKNRRKLNKNDYLRTVKPTIYAYVRQQ